MEEAVWMFQLTRGFGCFIGLAGLIYFSGLGVFWVFY